jgi:hypothetical protein
MPNPNLPEVITSGVTGHIGHHQSLHSQYNKPAPVSSKSGSYTLVISDAQSVIEFTSASAQTLTVPANSTVAFGVGTIINVYQQGTGSVSVAAAGGVSVESAVGQTSTRTLRGRYAEASLRKRASDVWVLAGDLT